MKEKQERQAILKRNSTVEENFKICANSLESLIDQINEFCFLFNKIKKRERTLKEKYYHKIFSFFLCLKGKYRNNEKIINEINNIKQQKDDFKAKLESMAEFYMNQKEEEINKDLYSCISKNSLFILILSIFHFYSLAEIHGYLFSLFGEIKRSSSRYFNGHYSTNKTFTEFFTNSTLTDSSQINFN